MEQKEELYGVTTDEIMSFLKDHMVTKEDLKRFTRRKDTSKSEADMVIQIRT